MLSNASTTENKKVLVRQLDYNTSQMTIQQYFTQFGHVREIIMKLNERGRSKGFCFVIFADTAVADKVLNTPHHVIDGKLVQIIRAGCMDGANKTCKLFCGGLPHGLTEDRLRQYFSTYGEIKDFEFIFDKDTAVRKHFCFIIFENPESVDKIVENKLPPASVIHHIGKFRIECKKKFEENHPIQRKMKSQKRYEHSSTSDNTSTTYHSYRAASYPNNNTNGSKSSMNNNTDVNYNSYYSNNNNPSSEDYYTTGSEYSYSATPTSTTQYSVQYGSSHPGYVAYPSFPPAAYYPGSHKGGGGPIKQRGGGTLRGSYRPY